MGRHTYAERVGFAKGLLKVLENRREDLAKAGINPAKMAKNLKKKIETSLEKNDKQEKSKARLLEDTKEATTADRDMYVTYSSYVDIVCGALMKNSADSKVLRRMRSKAKMEPREPKDSTGQ